MTRCSWVVAWLLLLTLVGLNTFAATPKRVLIVHSFGSAAPPFTTHSIAFETELTDKLGDQVDIDEVSLDMARYADTDMQEAFVEYLLKRQEKWQPDLVVPVGSPAGVFVAQYRNRLFPQTPIIYTGMDGRRLPPGTLEKNASFVGEDFNLPGFIEDMLQVAPATTNIAVVIGASQLEQYWAAAFRAAFEPFTNRVSFTWLNELSFDQMLERVGKLPPRSFIFVVLLLRDASGVAHNADEALRRIHAVANAPVNSIFQHQLGLGIVGGRLYQAELEGVESARIAIRVLQGESITNFPPIIVEPLPPRYDWRELQRWKISENALPPGSTVLFRVPGFWELYRWPIAGAVLFCLIQTTLIISLLVNRAKRRQGQAEAALIADISSKFVNLPPGEVDHEILDSQRRVFELLDLDVSGFWQWSAEGSGFFRLTHFSRTGEDSQIPERMNSQEYFPWYQKQVLAGRTVAVRSMKELPPEAARDRETFRQFGFKSNLTIPLSVGGGPPIGAIGFNTTRAERDWSDPLVKRLQLVAEIFANALARKQADQIAREFGGRLIQAQEGERARLARELHDDITQRLARLAIDAGRVELGTIDAGSSDIIREVREGLVRLSEDVHSLSYRLHPALLEDLGLAAALRAECERFTRQQVIPVELKLEKILTKIPSDTGLCLFRVTQEALRNVARHSSAGSAMVSLRHMDDGLQLAVSDRGIGFDPKQYRPKPSLGLASMRERVRSLDGELVIESTPGHGTTVVVWVPLKMQEV